MPLLHVDGGGCIAPMPAARVPNGSGWSQFHEKDESGQYAALVFLFNHFINLDAL